MPLSNVRVIVTPELAGYVTPSPSVLGSVPAGVPLFLPLLVNVPAHTPAGVVSGTLRLTDGNDTRKTFARPLPLSLSVYPPPKVPRVWRLEPGARVPAGCAPDIIRLDNGLYRMFYTVPGEGIGSALSSDGFDWNVEPGMRLAAKRIVGELNFDVTNPWTVRLADGRWRMYYQTFRYVGDASQVGSAVSVDGYQFVEEPGLRVAIGPTSGLSYAGHGRAWRARNGWFWMLFSVNTFDDMGASDIAVAKSRDGLTWTILNAHLFIDGHDPTILVNADNSISALWMYLDKAFYTSDSPDGIRWSPPAEVLLRDGDGQPPPADSAMGDVALLRLSGGNLRLFTNWAFGGIRSLIPAP